MNRVKVITEVDLDETDDDYIGGYSVPCYFIDGNEVHSQWIVRAGKSDSGKYGTLVQPLTDERILELEKAYTRETYMQYIFDVKGFARAIEKEILNNE